MLYLAALFVYFVDVYDTYLTILLIVFGVYTIYIFLHAVEYVFNFAESKDNLEKYRINFFKHLKSKLYIVMAALFILSPSVKTVYITSGLLIGQQAVNKAENSELLNKAYKVLELQMNTYLNELISSEKSEEPKQ